MGEKEFGNLILSSADMSSTPKTPEIQIRPNSSIPEVIGALLFLGGLAVSLLGLIASSAQFIEVDYQAQAKLSQSMGIDISAEDLELLDSEYKEQNYYLISGLLQVFPGLLLIIGGIQLLLCKKTGVYTSIAGGIMWFIFNLISSYWSSIIDSDLGISLETQWDTVETAMCSICNLFCILLPLIPMLVPAGKAALMPINHKLNVDKFVPKEEE